MNAWLKEARGLFSHFIYPDQKDAKGNTDPLPGCAASFLYPISLAPQALCFSSLTLFSSFTSLALSESYSKPAAERVSFQRACAYTSNSFWELPKSLPSKRGSEGWELCCFVSKHKPLSSEKIQELHNPEALNARAS